MKRSTSCPLSQCNHSQIFQHLLTDSCMFTIEVAEHSSWLYWVYELEKDTTAILSYGSMGNWSCTLWCFCHKGKTLWEKALSGRGDTPTFVGWKNKSIVWASEGKTQAQLALPGMSLQYCARKGRRAPGYRVLDSGSAPCDVWEGTVAQHPRDLSFPPKAEA